MDPRQMAMAMKRMGIDMRDVSDVVEVVVRTPAKEYVFTRPAVSIMKAQGQETWQVIGSPKVREASPQAQGPASPQAQGPSTQKGPTNTAAPLAAASAPAPRVAAPASPLASSPSPASQVPTHHSPASSSPPSPAALAPLSFTEEDVHLVMEQGHCSGDAARAALSATGGDLAEAILKVSKA